MAPDVESLSVGGLLRAVARSRLATSASASMRLGRHTFQIGARSAPYHRLAFGAVVIAAEAAHALDAGLAFVHVVVAAEAADARDAWYWLGAVIIAAGFLDAVWPAHFPGQQPTQVCGVGGGRYQDGQHDRQRARFPGHGIGPMTCSTRLMYPTCRPEPARSRWATARPPLARLLQERLRALRWA